MQENDAGQGLAAQQEAQPFEREEVAQEMQATVQMESEPLLEEPRLHHILVVEDDLDLATLEAGVLIAHGFTVDTVHSAEGAIATLHHSLPDLVVLDLELTGTLQGWDVLEALRATTTIPVLLTTSSATAVRERMHSQGETRITLDHLPKPYPMQTLLKRIKRMLPVAPQ